MNILIIGGGGREHALAWKIDRSPLVDRIYCAPGNAGIAQTAECVDLDASDFNSVIDFVRTRNIDLTVVGPEAYLVDGIVDRFQKENELILGPTRAAARLEGSKAFAKEFFSKYSIPTAPFRICSEEEEALSVLDGVDFDFPVVIKADGLAAGKGVIVCRDYKEALDAIQRIMENREFGAAGDRIVIEEFLVGAEMSYLVITDGETFVPLCPAQDHKQLLDGDRGPNTGGMGAIAHRKIIGKGVEEAIADRIVKPIIAGLAKEGTPYLGVLYCGLMLCADGPKVLEINCRFGDPETQPIMALMEDDIVPLMLGAVEGKLHQIPGRDARFSDRYAICVVMTSGGYPGSYTSGYPVSGLDQLRKDEDIFVFHAGTRIEDDRIVTSGGRVLSVTAVGGTRDGAFEKAYLALSKISFDGAFFRRDIGLR